MHYNHSYEYSYSVAVPTLPAFTLPPLPCSNWPNGSNCTAMGNSSAMPDNLLEMEFEMDSGNWPLERVVSMVVPVFFGIIGLAGLLGNALVILGKFYAYKNLLFKEGFSKEVYQENINVSKNGQLFKIVVKEFIFRSKNVIHS